MRVWRICHYIVSLELKVCLFMLGDTPVLSKLNVQYSIDICGRRKSEVNNDIRKKLSMENIVHIIH